MHLNCFLWSQTHPWGGRLTRLTVTDAHLQQKKYEVNNPKVSSPEMWLASKLDSETMTETTSRLLRILWVLVYVGMRSADQQYIYRMGLWGGWICTGTRWRWYQAGKPRGWGWHQRQQRREGGEGWYNDNAINGKKCDKEGQEDIGNNHGSLLLLLLPPHISKFILQIDQTLETIHHNLILVLLQGVNKYLQLH